MAVGLACWLLDMTRQLAHRHLWVPPLYIAPQSGLE
jgi:hypothetical protein